MKREIGPLGKLQSSQQIKVESLKISLLSIAGGSGLELKRIIHHRDTESRRTARTEFEHGGRGDLLAEAALALALQTDDVISREPHLTSVYLVSSVFKLCLLIRDSVSPW